MMTALWSTALPRAEAQAADFAAGAIHARDSISAQQHCGLDAAEADIRGMYPDPDILRVDVLDINPGATRARSQPVQVSSTPSATP
jgi:hypothetical protein